jgi:hypothetical protein
MTVKRREGGDFEAWLTGLSQWKLNAMHSNCSKSAIIRATQDALTNVKGGPPNREKMF